MATRTGEPVSERGVLMGGSPEEVKAIRDDITRTRQDMSRTVDAIEHRLSPAHLKQQVTGVKEHVIGEIRDAKDQLKGDLSDEIDAARSKVRDATVGRVEHMVHDARDRVSDAGSGLLHTIKENPVPAALVAVGLGWLAMSARGGGGSSSRGSSRFGGVDEDGYRYSYRYGPSLGGTRPRDRAAHALHDATEGISRTASDLGHRVQQGAGHLAHEAGHAMHEARDKASEVVHDAERVGRRAVRTASREARHLEQSFESTLRENPLAVGAIAIAVGAAIGLALPHTRKEDQWMGSARDRLLHKAEGAAEGALQQVEEKVEEKVAALESGGDSNGGAPSSRQPNGFGSHKHV
jgi:ElaB/YqjD/DUF883 family membrane-anchored ribosome-binding protein/uncharacterized protein YjbJ (UPF0337 family)